MQFPKIQTSDLWTFVDTNNHWLVFINVKKKHIAFAKFVFWTPRHIRLVPLSASPALISSSLFLHVSLWATQRVRLRTTLDTLPFPYIYIYTHILKLTPHRHVSTGLTIKSDNIKKQPGLITTTRNLISLLLFLQVELDQLTVRVRKLAGAPTT